MLIIKCFITRFSKMEIRRVYRGINHLCLWPRAGRRYGWKVIQCRLNCVALWKKFVLGQNYFSKISSNSSSGQVKRNYMVTWTKMRVRCAILLLFVILIPNVFWWVCIRVVLAKFTQRVPVHCLYAPFRWMFVICMDGLGKPILSYLTTTAITHTDIWDRTREAAVESLCCNDGATWTATVLVLKRPVPHWNFG